MKGFWISNYTSWAWVETAAKTRALKVFILVNSKGYFFLIYLWIISEGELMLICRSISLINPSWVRKWRPRVQNGAKGVSRCFFRALIDFSSPTEILLLTRLRLIITKGRKNHKRPYYRQLQKYKVKKVWQKLSGILWKLFKTKRDHWIQ